VGESHLFYLTKVLSAAAGHSRRLNSITRKVSRARHSDVLTRALSVIGNVLILVLAVEIAWPVRYRLLHNRQALGILIVTAIELLFALRG
jgi:hypothetical protein